MAICRSCGGQMADGTRFCPHCGADAAMPPRQAGYGPPPQALAGPGAGRGSLAAYGLGIGGGILGVIWGGLAPYLTYRFPNDINWSMYGTNLGEPEVGLVIGLVLGVLGIIGGVLAPRSRGVAAFLLLFCGIVGFVLGQTWLIPGAMLLAAGGLALASNRA
ncbi:MAG: hypothetical protein JW990_20095 [Thermoleophilia bacterium]|nr:hypothetical protein [Thermoleophilia bacterium]